MGLRWGPPGLGRGEPASAAWRSGAAREEAPCDGEAQEFLCRFSLDGKDEQLEEAHTARLVRAPDVWCRLSGIIVGPEDGTGPSWALAEAPPVQQLGGRGRVVYLELCVVG